MNAPMARCGWTGKLPSSGDFLSRRVEPAFAAPWEQWLLAVLAGSRERLRERWQESFLSAPAWRFVLAPGVLSPRAWCGVMVPSVDSVGRYYPLTLVCGLEAGSLDPDAALAAMGSWFAMAEMLGTEALSPAIEISAFDDSIAALPLPDCRIDRAAPSAARLKPCSAWSSETSEVASGMQFTIEGLPDIEQYCTMLTGKPIQVAAAS
ncbi:MAG: type VI secretion system-associated protein TagF [Betaproteobacteria bacterium]